MEAELEDVEQQLRKCKTVPPAELLIKYLRTVRARGGVRACVALVLARLPAHACLPAVAP